MGAAEFQGICIQSLGPRLRFLVVASLGTWMVSAAAVAETTFRDHVRPILRGECMQCHNADKAKGGLDLSTYESLLQGGSAGEIVVPGDPDGSRLLQTMAHTSEPFMPQNASKRPDDELDTVKRWIAEGLLKQSGDTAKKPAANRVSLQPVEMSMDRPSGPAPLPKNGRLEPYMRTRHANVVIALDTSPWAPLVAVGGHRQVVLYNDETGELLDVRAFEEGLPTTVGFSHNARILLAAGGVGGRSGSIALWDVVSGEKLAQVGDEFDTVLAAHLSPDQRWVVLGGTDKLAKILAVETGEVIHKIKKHTDWVVSAAFSPDGVLVATGDRSGGLTVWEAESGQEFHDLRGHEDAITRIRWRGDANILASASEDGQIKLWDMHKGKVVKSWKAHNDGVLDLAYAKNGLLASVGRDGRAKIWKEDGKMQREISTFEDLPTRCAFSHDDLRLLVGDWTGTVSTWKVEDGSRLGAMDANPPRLEERVDAAAQLLAQARNDLEPVRDRARQADESLSALGRELAALETRRQEADARHADCTRRLAEATEQRQAAEDRFQGIRGQRESMDTRVSELAERLAAIDLQMESARQTMRNLEAPADAVTLADAGAAPDRPVAPPESQPAPAEPAREPGTPPEPETANIRQRIAELESERIALQAEIREAGIELEALRRTESEHEQALSKAAGEVSAAERSVLAAATERDQAGDVLPAKRAALETAEAVAAEAAVALNAAEAALADREAVHHQWAEALRLQGIRDEGIREDGVFAATVLPILDAHCVKCHGLAKAKGTFRVDRPDLIVQGGESGAPGLVAGDPEASELWYRMSLPPDDIDIMPPEGDPLTPEQIEIVRAWIEAGGTF